ncbi:hypothetical protein HMPREF3191_00373 [Veillonellaceae bacterium DNF00626]|nr:hypothetical protein HMPREF3191_00373 [Veillonellaceae bacterium DNF00626]
MIINFINFTSFRFLQYSTIIFIRDKKYYNLPSGYDTQKS